MLKPLIETAGETGKDKYSPNDRLPDSGSPTNLFSNITRMKERLSFWGCLGARRRPDQEQNRKYKSTRKTILTTAGTTNIGKWLIFPFIWEWNLSSGIKLHLNQYFIQEEVHTISHFIQNPSSLGFWILEKTVFLWKGLINLSGAPQWMPCGAVVRVLNVNSSCLGFRLQVVEPAAGVV